MSGVTSVGPKALIVALLLVPTVSLGGPATQPELDRAGLQRNVPQLRRGMEDDMAALGRLAQQARRKGDLVRLGCIRDKQERADGVMEVATGELLVLRDSTATAQATAFAGEKLAATAEKLHALVNAAGACGGDQSPEEEEDVANNDMDREAFIPYLDPTSLPPSSPVPPSVDDTVPPVVASAVL